jgi:hypothetical protein
MNSWRLIPQAEVHDAHSGFDISGTKGALRFDAQDQNALWYYDCRARPGRGGFAKLLMGPEHPDFGAFVLGPGHQGVSSGHATVDR